MHETPPHAVDAHEVIATLREARRAAGRLLLGLDFDGTLAEIVPRPDDAALLPGAASVLARLAARSDTIIAVITGRGVSDVRDRMAGVEAHFAGNHGMEIAGPGVDWLHPEAAAARPYLVRLLGQLRHDLDHWDGIIFEDKGVSMSVHFRTVTDAAADREIVETIHRTAAVVGGPIRLTDGKKVVELRPDVDWDKGRALVYLRGQLRLTDVPTIFIGDDRTDEDAFREVVTPPDLGIVVGTERLGETAARAVLRDPVDVVRFLTSLAEQ